MTNQFILILVLFSFLASAQESLPDTKEEALTEAPHYGNGFKIDVFNLLSGKAGVAYERRLSKKFILDIEANIFLPNYNGYSVQQEIGYGRLKLNNPSGFSFKIMPKYIFNYGDVGDCGWYGISYEFAFEKADQIERNRQSFAIHWGAEYALFKSKHFYTFMSIGMGITFTEKFKDLQIYDFGILVPLKAGFGYLF